MEDMSGEELGKTGVKRRGSARDCKREGEKKKNPMPLL